MKLKLEIAKSGGIVYTPEFIVDAIVREVVIPRIEGRSPEALANVKIVDPACGSGTFLLAAFEAICVQALKWYTDSSQKERRATAVFVDGNGDLHLTTGEKRRLLLSCIFGLDKDAQAVEVTQLSLYLKLLEDETKSTLNAQRAFFPRETFLPHLSENIRVGNALVDSSIAKVVRDPDELAHINPFTWAEAFKNLGKAGFDIVLGNPPYVRIQTMREYAPQEADFIRKNYETAATGTVDLYVPFIEKGMNLLNRGGALGMIVSNKFLNSQYGSLLRTKLGKMSCVKRIVHFGSNQVFQDRATYTCILHLENRRLRSWLPSFLTAILLRSCQPRLSRTPLIVANWAT